MSESTRLEDHLTPAQLEALRKAAHGTVVDAAPNGHASESAPPVPGPKSGGDAKQGRIVARTPDLKRARPPRWAWRHRIVTGYLNLLLGEEGIGKGVFAAYLIARLTLGQVPGDLSGTPVRVGIVADEDSFDDVWTPRLHAAGANCELVRQLDVPDGGLIDLNRDRDQLRDLVNAEGLGFLFFDALLDNLGIGIDDWRAKQVREALKPLRWIARDADVAVLGSLHPNKRGGSFRELVSGSSAFSQVSRSGLLLARHPDDERRRVLVRGKGNLSEPPLAFEFSIASHKFGANGHEFDVGLAEQFGESDLTVDDLIAAGGTRVDSSKVGAAGGIIEALLPRDGEWHPAQPIFDAAEQEDIDDRTVQRARSRRDIDHKRDGKFPAPVLWRWRTPDTHDTHDTHDNSDTRQERVGTASDHSPDTHTSRDMAVGSVVSVVSAGDQGATDDELLAAFPGSSFTTDPIPSDAIVWDFRAAAANGHRAGK